MRHLPISFLLLLAGFFISSLSQGQSVVGKIYVSFSDQLPVYGLDEKGNLDSSLRYTVKNGTKFSIVGFDDNNNVLITFWRYASVSNFGNLPSGKRVYPTDTISKAGYRHYPSQFEFIGAWANYKKFAMGPKVLNSSCKEYYGSKKEFTWGVMTLPVKVRFGNGKERLFDFEERLNLGFVFGMKKQLKGYVPQSLNYLAGFGISSAKTDSASLRDVSFYDGKTSLALSFHSGMLYQFDNFQVGLFLGIDIVPGITGRYWFHQTKPWIGLAVGVSLFSKNSTGGDNKNNTQ